MERRNLATRPLRYLPTAREWVPFEDLGMAVNEAEDMTKQYSFFLRLKQTSTTQDQTYFDRECMQARRFMMDANSFVVSLRRRGFKHALEELGVERTLIGEEDPAHQVAVGTQTSLFPPRPAVQRAAPESKYSTLFSR
jgi:hypothetical protein